MPEHHDQRDRQFHDPERDASEHRVVQDLTGRPYGHQIAEPLVEDQLRRDAGVDAAQDDGERVLAPDQRLPYGPGGVGMPLVERPPADVAGRQRAQRRLGRVGPRAVQTGTRTARRGAGPGRQPGTQGHGAGQGAPHESAPPGSPVGAVSLSNDAHTGPS